MLWIQCIWLSEESGLCDAIIHCGVTMHIFKLLKLLCGSACEGALCECRKDWHVWLPYDQQGLLFEVVMEVVSNWTICECTHNNNNNNEINWRSWSHAILVWLGNSQIPNVFSGIHSDSMDGRLWETQALLPCKNDEYHQREGLVKKSFDHFLFEFLWDELVTCAIQSKFLQAIVHNLYNCELIMIWIVHET